MGTTRPPPPQIETHLVGHRSGEPFLRHTGGGQLVSHVGDGGQGGGAGGGEGDRSAVGDQGHHTGGHRREPQTHQQRRCQRRRRAESGRAFDERPKEVADDDGLDAGVGEMV